MQSFRGEFEVVCLLAHHFTDGTHEASFASTKFWPIMRLQPLDLLNTFGARTMISNSRENKVAENSLQLHAEVKGRTNPSGSYFW